LYGGILDDFVPSLSTPPNPFALNNLSPDTIIMYAVDGNNYPLSNGVTTTSNKITIVFRGIGNLGISGYHCNLDSGQQDVCSNNRNNQGIAFDNLQQGTHTFVVRSVDIMGNVDSSPARFTWNIAASPSLGIQGQAQQQENPFLKQPYYYYYFLAPSIATAPSTTGCDQSLWNHVYNPSRLQIINPCITVTGTIDKITPEADGDEHIRLKLDPQFSNLINSANIQGQDGDLLVEPICVRAVTQPDAFSACFNFHQNIAIPPIGTHVQITGSYVLDKQHGGWAEIHPVTSIVKISSSTTQALDTIITSAIDGNNVNVQNGGSTISGQITFTFTNSSGNATGFQCSLDSSTFSACFSPVTYQTLSNGGHTFQVMAVNASDEDSTPAIFVWSTTTWPSPNPYNSTGSQVILQYNNCGNGTLPLFVICNNTASQVQGYGNTVNVIANK
jgi:hypothetical protein